jgi:cytochrome c oxidase assembly protein subunit 11
LRIECFLYDIAALPHRSGKGLQSKQGSIFVFPKCVLVSRGFSPLPPERTFASGGGDFWKSRFGKRKESAALYATALAIAVGGLSYASVPLYRLFCSKTGYAGTVKTHDDVKYEQKAHPIVGKKMLTIRFNADTSDGMPWRFWPQQKEVKVVPGEAALTFYSAENVTDQSATPPPSLAADAAGLSLACRRTMCSLTPLGHTLTRSKSVAHRGLLIAQCFCFEEQMLKPHETIDMPVFFFIDPEFLNDPALKVVDVITLSYTFFKAGDETAENLLATHQPVAATA